MMSTSFYSTDRHRPHRSTSLHKLLRRLGSLWSHSTVGELVSVFDSDPASEVGHFAHTYVVISVRKHTVEGLLTTRHLVRINLPTFSDMGSQTDIRWVDRQ